ncbi:MAG: hypothetical protein IJ057_10440 [Bacteroidales bacterium]|nr:hypothetical protein [Bacteroidales bacterium]
MFSTSNIIAFVVFPIAVALWLGRQTFRDWEKHPEDYHFDGKSKDGH